MATLQGVWQRPGPGPEACGELASRGEGGDSQSRITRHCESRAQALVMPEWSPVAFFAKVKMEVSGQPQVRWQPGVKLNEGQTAGGTADQAGDRHRAEITGLKPPPTG